MKFLISTPTRDMNNMIYGNTYMICAYILKLGINVSGYTCHLSHTCYIYIYICYLVFLLSYMLSTGVASV